MIPTSSLPLNTQPSHLPILPPDSCTCVSQVLQAPQPVPDREDWCLPIRRGAFQQAAAERMRTVGAAARDAAAAMQLEGLSCLRRQEHPARACGGVRHLAGLQRAPWHHQLGLLRATGALPLSSRRGICASSSDVSRAPSEQVWRRHVPQALCGNSAWHRGSPTRYAERGSCSERASRPPLSVLEVHEAGRTFLSAPIDCRLKAQRDFAACAARQRAHLRMLTVLPCEKPFLGAARGGEPA